MKKLPAKIANPVCSLLKPINPKAAYDVWAGAEDEGQKLKPINPKAATRLKRKAK